MSYATYEIWEWFVFTKANLRWLGKKMQTISHELICIRGIKKLQRTLYKHPNPSGCPFLSANVLNPDPKSHLTNLLGSNDCSRLSFWLPKSEIVSKLPSLHSSRSLWPAESLAQTYSCLSFQPISTCSPDLRLVATFVSRQSLFAFHNLLMLSLYRGGTPSRDSCYKVFPGACLHYSAQAHALSSVFAQKAVIYSWIFCVLCTKRFAWIHFGKMNKRVFS